VHDHCPLKRWTDHVEDITKMKKSEHLKQAYITLIEKLQLQELNSDSDRYEFLKVRPHCGSPGNTLC